VKAYEFVLRMCATGFAGASVRKRAVYLRLSVTDRCNLRCRYCRPASSEQDIGRKYAKGTFPFINNPSAADRELLELVRIMHEELWIRKLRLTGGEPLLHPHLVDLVVQLRRQLPQSTLCMTTNGTFLAKKAETLRIAGLDSLNVSLDTLNPDLFRELTGGGFLEDTIAGIGAAHAAGFTGIKLNAVLIRGINGESVAELVRFAARMDCEIRFIELMPYGHGSALFHTDYLAADEALSSLKKEFSYIGPLARSGTAARYSFLVDGRAINVGFITPVSHPFCSDCDRLRLSRTGQLFTCLRQQQGVDLLTLLRAGELDTLNEQIRTGFSGKHVPGNYWPDQHMVSIGG